MMTQLLKYEDFKIALLSGIQDLVPSEYKNYTVELHRITKGNQTLDGICMLDKTAEKSAPPVIYADEFYSEYIKDHKRCCDKNE